MRKKGALVRLLVAGAACLAAVILTIVLATRATNAATGDLVGSVTFSTDCVNGASLGVGIAFDGTNLWYTCYSQTTDIYKANTSGTVLASYASGKGGLGAIAWDAGAGVLWAGAGCGPGQSGAEIYQINPSNGLATLWGTVPTFTGGCLDDGLAFDGTNQTFYHSWDGATTIRHLSVGAGGGGPLATQLDDNFAWGGSGCYNSGLAIGGQLLYQGSNGCSHVWVVDKGTKGAAFDFSTVVAGDPNFRDEDLECDTNTFAGLGKHVMWSKEAYNPQRAHAFEIPFGSCGIGGQPATITPTMPRPTDTPTPTPTPTARPVGGISFDPGAGAPSRGNSGMLTGLFAGTAAVAIALGGAAWYARRRRVR